MVYSFKEGFKVTDGESNETIREAEMQLCLSESGLNSRNQIRKLFEFADLDFFNLFAGEKKKDSEKKKDDGAEGAGASDKADLDVNRGWLI